MKIKRQGMRRGISLLPNLLTTANLFCGFFSITKSLNGEFVFAAWLVVFAGFFDFLDGRVARMTGTQSDFGVEFDSLSDLTTFCMAPAILAFQWSLWSFGKIGIAACFLFFACGALRLARFNVQAGSVEKVDFQGLPTPAAGGTLVSFVVFYSHWIGVGQNPRSFLVLAMVAALGLLMVSNVKYRSAKKVQRTSFVFFVVLVTIVFFLAAQPETMFFAVGVLYVSAGLMEWIWTSPQKIRNLTDLMVRIYNHRRENFVYDEDEEEISQHSKKEKRENVLSMNKDDV